MILCPALRLPRNPFDFYVAEHERDRRRWVHELPDPGSWVHATPGAVGRIVDADDLARFGYVF